VLATPTALIGLLLAAGQLLALLALLAPAVMARFGKEGIIVASMLGMALVFLPVLFMAHWLAVGVSFIGMVGLVAISGPVYQLYSMEVVQPQWHTAIASAGSMAVGVSIAAVALGGGYVIVGDGLSYPVCPGHAASAGGGAALWRLFSQITPHAASGHRGSWTGVKAASIFTTLTVFLVSLTQGGKSMVILMVQYNIRPGKAAEYATWAEA